MARTVAQGFDVFFEWLVPLESDRQSRVKHRARIETSLRNALTVSLFREIGSFTHGTGVCGHCDADLLVSIKGGKPDSSDTALGWVKSALQTSFPSTYIHVSRPAVVVEFAGGDETWEVTPAFFKGRTNDDDFIYDIPGAASGWMESAPQAHLSYVTDINGMERSPEVPRSSRAWQKLGSTTTTYQSRRFTWRCAPLNIWKTRIASTR